MLNFFNVNTIMIDIAGYPLSYIEFVGTVFYFLSVFLISKKNILTWPIGIISVILYGILFYQIQLYSDMMEQAYYLVISIIGWLLWKKKQDEVSYIPTSWSSFKIVIFFISITAIFTAALAYCVSNFHIWLPRVFPEPASFPFLDALTTIMSFVAMYLTTIRKNEGWIYWIIVDVIGIGLYWVKDVRFIAIQYVILLCMAVYGLINWMRKNHPTTAST